MASVGLVGTKVERKIRGQKLMPGEKYAGKISQRNQPVTVETQEHFLYQVFQFNKELILDLSSCFVESLDEH